MANFNLQQTLQVYSYNVEVYSLENETLNLTLVSQAVASLTESSMPNHIVEVLEVISGVSKIRVLDLNNNLILNSEKYIPE